MKIRRKAEREEGAEKGRTKNQSCGYLTQALIQLHSMVFFESLLHAQAVYQYHCDSWKTHLLYD